MTDDDPLDLAQVMADDSVIDRLRNGSLEPNDPVVALLRDLLTDLETDLPSPEPVGRGSTVVALAGEHSPNRRLARRGTVVALLTAGVVSVGGMAAASTVDNPSHPLHGLGEAVRAATAAVVDAVTPPSAPPGSPTRDPAGRSAGAAAPVPAPAAEAAPAPGRAVSAAARSQAALRQVEALLDEAESLLDAGRVSAASARLDTAERRLRDVLPDQRPAPVERLTELRKRVAAATAPAPRPAREQRPAQAPAAKPDSPRPAKQPEQAGQSGQAGQSKDDARHEGPKAGPKAQQDDSSTEPAEDADAPRRADRPIPEPQRSVTQSARLASTNPRA